MLRRGLLVTAVAMVSTAVVGIFINYATVTRPAWLNADPWRPWLFLAFAVLIALILALFAYFLDGDSTPVQVHLPAPAPQFSTAPSSLTPPRVDPEQVLGREVELRQLVRLLAKPTKLRQLVRLLAKPATADDRFVVVAGTGGIGKTTLAAAAAAIALQAGLRVMWLRCRNIEGPDSLVAGMVEVACALGLSMDKVNVAQQCRSSLVDLVWDRLNATSGWMLVIDDLDQPSAVAFAGDQLAEYRGWIRPSRTGLLLVTSRDQDATTWGSAAQLIHLGPLDGEVGARVLLAAAPGAGTPEEALLLAERLGGLPLALCAASAAVAEPTGSLRSFAAYRQALASRSLSVLPDLPAQPDLTNQETARNLVGHTWELSLDQLDANEFGVARPLLRLLALFAEAPIPRSLLTAQLVGQVLGADVSTAALDGALAGLRRYGLLDTPDLTRTRQIATLALHPLVRETSILLLERTADPQPWREALSSWLTSVIHRD